MSRRISTSSLKRLSKTIRKELAGIKKNMKSSQSPRRYK